MGKTFNLTVTPRDGEPFSFSGEIPAGEWELLQKYCRAVDRIGSIPLVQAGWTQGVRIQYEAGSGFLPIDPSTLPSDPDLFALYHVARPIILEGEPFSFSKALAIVARRVSHPQLTAWKELRRRFDSRRIQEMYKFSAGPAEDPLVLNSEEALRLWLNGYEYHQDEEKAAYLENVLGNTITMDHLKGIVLEVLREKISAAARLQAVIRSLDGPKGTSFKFRP